MTGISILDVGLPEWRRRLDAGFLDALQASDDAGGAEDAASWLPLLQERVRHDLDRLARLAQSWDVYAQRYRRAVTSAERRGHVLWLAERLGATRADLRRDRAGFGRWFGHDTVTGRYRRRRGETLRGLGCHLERLGVLAGFALERLRDPSLQATGWRRWQLEALLVEILERRLDPRTDRILFEAARTMAVGAHPDLRAELLPGTILDTAARLGRDGGEDAWVRVAALELLEVARPAGLEQRVIDALAAPGAGDDRFVRARLVAAAGRHLEGLVRLGQVLRLGRSDPSPHVRQAVARLARAAGPGVGEEAWEAMAAGDPVAEVRRAALLAAAEGLEAGDGASSRILRRALAEEEDALTLRVALEAVERGQDLLVALDDERARRWATALEPPIRELRGRSGSIAVRRWAGETMNRLWVTGRPAARGYALRVAGRIREVPPGESIVLPAAARLDAGDDEAVGRALAELARSDFGLYLDPGRQRDRLLRGERYGFRLWRLVHELLHSAPDKRQGHSHSRGRVHYGRLAAPAGRLAELTETGVPGEPVFLAEEQGHRPYLPLLDDVVSTLNQWGGVRESRFFTAEGVTRVAPPASSAARLAAWARLTASFPRVAQLRNWREREGGDPAAYVAELRRLGFDVRFDPWAGEPADPTVTRFFPAALPLPLADLLPQLEEYFLSLYGNSLRDLALVTGVGTAIFVSRHLVQTRRIRRDRRRIPLVIGGWGTRGKSSVERLKAALFSGLGYATFCKTTGCEAMFLDAPAYCELSELPLFRSYDKATIWEQGDVLRIAAGLGAEVFLWECMALNPRYVKILQRDWMQDDLATLTNAYPDHEDLQGPAGIDIPRVMGEFVPAGSKLLTAEEGMLPVLRESARKVGTEVVAVGWLDTALLAPDLLERFPYQEHPANVVLVAALAGGLGIAADLAIATMANRVVPDLGVLKTYPEARIGTRRLLFSNGMSANERHAALGNWRRLGLERAEPRAGEWVTTVVNNRADRVPRSKVFAGVLVDDLSADRHFLIGTNLGGLRSYIDEAWEETAHRIGAASGEEPGAAAAAWAGRFRLPTTPEEVRSRLASMLSAVAPGEETDLERLWEDPEALASALAGLETEVAEAADLLRHHRRHLDAWREVREIRELDRTTRPADRWQRVRRLARRWLDESLVVIEDPHASGDQILERIVRETPPGTRNHVVGVQNIKGTGLDFVYRWVAWERCRRNLDALEGGDREAARRAVRDLASEAELGLLSLETVRSVVERVRHAQVAQHESFQAQLEVVRANVERAASEIRSHLREGATSGGRGQRLLEWVEGLLDAGDAVRRRRAADRIYLDLRRERISHARAALELHELDRRQKGGWVLRELRAMVARRRSPREGAPTPGPTATIGGPAAADGAGRVGG